MELYKIVPLLINSLKTQFIPIDPKHRVMKGPQTYGYEGTPNKQL